MDAENITAQQNSTVVALIFIDNYDEAMDALEEFRRPIVIALTERKLGKIAGDLGGILRGFEKDKFLLIFSSEKLPQLIETKFECFDNIKDADKNVPIPLTLSIGIGVGGDTLANTMEYARAAVDLALSRGGEQIIVRDRDSNLFFGGRSKDVGKPTRVRARVKAYALSEIISESSNVLIMGHNQPDMDCMGAAIGVYTIASFMQKECYIVVNNISDAISRMVLNVKKDENYKNAFCNSEEAFKIINSKTLLVVVDAHRPFMCEEPQLLEKIKRVVVFDHHRKSVDAIDNLLLSYHEPSASSASELITEMIMYNNKNIKLSPAVADAMLAGINLDTKGFALKTGTKTFEAAAYLRKNGADPARVRILFKTSREDYLEKQKTVCSAEMFTENMAISVFEGTSDSPMVLSAQAADELLYIDNIEASFVLCKYKDRICISARSLETINVQEIMENMGGGGHQSVSAVQLKNTTIDEAKENLKKAINKYISE